MNETMSICPTTKTKFNLSQNPSSYDAYFSPGGQFYTSSLQYEKKTKNVV